MEKIKLTQTVQKGGCAAKIAAQELREILKHVKFPTKPPELLVDGEYFDDAAIYQVTPEIGLVQTLDFFTPIVDSPKMFGKIAATNALSDVYAMGGRPRTAMGILAFPLATLPQEVIVEVMQGASDQIGLAGAAFVGGHSIDDETLKFGLSVTGYVHPQKVWSNSTAREGDVLLLTKPLGTGTLTAGLKKQSYSEERLQEALTSMSTLNNIIDFLPEELCQKIHAATDITGFGLSGHSMQMALASRVHLRFESKKLPLFALALESLESGHLTKAHKSNETYTREKFDTSALSSLQRLILHDPQTSGGLLLSVDPSAATEIIEKLRTSFSAVSQVGIVEKSLDQIAVTVE